MGKPTCYRCGYGGVMVESPVNPGSFFHTRLQSCFDAIREEALEAAASLLVDGAPADWDEYLTHRLADSIRALQKDPP